MLHIRQPQRLRWRIGRGQVGREAGVRDIGDWGSGRKDRCKGIVILSKPPSFSDQAAPVEMRRAFDGDAQQQRLATDAEPLGAQAAQRAWVNRVPPSSYVAVDILCKLTL